MPKGGVQMAAKLQCPIVFARLTRRAGRWGILVSKPLYRVRDDDACHQFVSDEIARWVRREPHLWLWLHRRWRVSC